MIYLGIVLASALALAAILASSIKNVLRWRHRQRELSVLVVEHFASDLGISSGLMRAELAGKMLSMLRSDVEFCLAHRFSPRTVLLAGLFFAVYALYRTRIALGFPPRQLTTLCRTVRRLGVSTA